MVTAASALVEATAALHSARSSMVDAATLRHHRSRATGLWRGLDVAAREAAERFVEHPDVIGVSAGFRLRAGTIHPNEPVLTVFVREKRDPVELGIRQVDAMFERRNRRTPIPTDIVPLGAFRELVAAGDPIGLQGSFDSATITCIARHLPTDTLVALTARHLTRGRPGPFVTPSQRHGASGPLGNLVAEAGGDIDAAAVAIDQTQPWSNTPEAMRPMRGWRPLVDPADRSIAVAMRGAGDSPAAPDVRFGWIEHPRAILTDPAMSEAILVRMSTRDGDSGGPLVDNSGHLLGLLRGAYERQNLAVFTPIGAALAALRCDLP
jgi:hypothetical protein